MLSKQSTFGDGAFAIPAITTLFSLSRVIILLTEREGLTVEEADSSELWVGKPQDYILGTVLRLQGRRE